MALLATGSPLVAGSVLEETMATKSVRVLRSFFYNRTPTKPGDVMDLPLPFALELIAATKAEAVEPIAAPAKAVEADNNDDSKNAHKGKGSGHAK
jgi:hypothetical protein